MRKDGKSQYQLKKEKLKEIKYILEENYKNYEYQYLEIEMTKGHQNFIDLIWEIVKNEK